MSNCRSPTRCSYFCGRSQPPRTDATPRRARPLARSRWHVKLACVLRLRPPFRRFRISCAADRSWLWLTDVRHAASREAAYASSAVRSHNSSSSISAEAPPRTRADRMPDVSVRFLASRPHTSPWDGTSASACVALRRAPRAATPAVMPSLGGWRQPRSGCWAL